VSAHHYENFPVASLLCPPTLRPTVMAIYAFARTADDLADEGAASPSQRLEDLGAYQADLTAVSSGLAPSPRWRDVFEPLAAALDRHALPVPLLADLLSAFRQDVVQGQYPDRAALLDYCRRSANPVGRLLMHLYAIADPDALLQSDAICTALQLANFWQDLSVDTTRGRLYIPLADCHRHGATPNDILSRHDSPQLRALVAEMVHWARTLMAEGAPLVHRIPARAGWELRLVVQGGLAILHKIEQMEFATLQRRPALRWYDAPATVWHAITMRPAVALPVEGRA